MEGFSCKKPRVAFFIFTGRVHCLRQTPHVQAEKYYCRKRNESEKSWGQLLTPALTLQSCGQYSPFLAEWLKFLDHDFLIQGWHHAVQTCLAAYFLQDENFGISRGDTCWFRDSLRDIFIVLSYPLEQKSFYNVALCMEYLKEMGWWPWQLRDIGHDNLTSMGPP